MDGFVGITDRLDGFGLGHLREKIAQCLAGRGQKLSWINNNNIAPGPYADRHSGHRCNKIHHGSKLSPSPMTPDTAERQPMQGPVRKASNPARATESSR